MELRTYLAITGRHRWTLILVPLLSALIALGATYVVSPRFVGVAVVQIIPEEIEPRAVSLRNQEGASTIAIGLRDPTELLAQSVVESLGSREVAQQVAADLRLAELPAPQGWDAFKSQARQLLDDAWALLRFGYVARTPNEAAVVDRTGESLGAELVRGSYFMEIYATWRDPQTAADMANAAVRGVLEHTRAIARASAAEQRQFLEAQRLAARRDVETARSAMIQYSSASDVVAGTSVRVAVSALETARAAARQNELDQADAERRLAIARDQLAALDPNTVTETRSEGTSAAPASTTSRVVSPNLAYQTLQERIAQLGQEVAALETRRDQNGSEVTAQLDLELADRRQRLATAEEQLKQDLDDLVRAQIQSQALTLQQEIAALEAQRDQALASRQAQTDRELAEARRRLTEAQAQLGSTNPTVESVQSTTASSGGSGDQSATVSSPNPVFQSIQRDVLTLEQTVTALREQQGKLREAVQQREQALRTLTASDGQLEALNQELALASETYRQRTAEWYNASMEESRPVAPIRLIDPAVPPVYPAYPIKVYWALIGLAAGLAAAVVLVFMRSATDLTLRSPEEAEEALTMPLLAVVPRAAGGRRGGAR